MCNKYAMLLRPSSLSNIVVKKNTRKLKQNRNRTFPYLIHTEFACLCPHCRSVSKSRMSTCEYVAKYACVLIAEMYRKPECVNMLKVKTCLCPPFENVPKLYRKCTSRALKKMSKVENRNLKCRKLKCVETGSKT